MDFSIANRRCLTSDVDIYACGGCRFKSTDIREFHLHLQDHPEGGSYYYNSNLKIAFPKYDTVCAAVQTDDLASIGAEDKASDANSQYFKSNTELVKEEDYKSFDAESIALAIGSVNRKNDDVNDRDRDFKDHDFHLQRINQIFNECESPMLPNNVNITTFVKSDIGMHNVVKIEPSYSFDVIEDHVNEQNNKGYASLNVNDNENLADITICSKGSENDIETNKIDNVKVVCQLCNRVFCNGKSLNRHNNKFHKSKNNKDLESHASSDSTEINTPKNVTNRKRNYYKKKCKVCGELMHSNNLKLHMRCHNDEKPYKCNLCDKVHNNNRSLQDHLKLHEGKINYLCQYCGKGCVNHHQYEAHRNLCRKKYVCEVCGANYSNKAGLTNHMRKHTGDKPFMCQVCGFATAIEWSLKNHIKFKHSNEKTHKCDNCDKSFACKDTLKRHKRVHLKIRPHVCKSCNKCFSESWNLNAHMRQHTGDKPYKCINCGVGFAHNVVRKTHEAKCHVTAEIVKTIDKS